MRINIYLDESGSIHKNSPTSYFVIGGYIAFGDANKIHKIINRYKKINKRHKIARSMPLDVELKTRDMTVDEKKEILTKIQGLENFYGCAIQFDKKSMTKRIENSNVFFNYGVKLLFKDVILPILPSLSKDEEYEFVLAIDNRNIGVGELKDLEKYLNTEFCYQNYSFDVTYYDSASHYGIQLADFVVNTMYMRTKDFDKVREVINEMDSSKFRLGMFPGKGITGRISTIDFELL